MSEVEVSREYAQLMRRGGRPYSAGHRVMYDTPLTLMSRNERATEKFSILDVGFGIGYGLDRMVDAGVIGEYVGLEPDDASFRYVATRHGHREGVTLLNERFADGVVMKAEHVFCIEVIEHVPADEHEQFLGDLFKAALGGTLWLSTPDMDRCPEHGVRSAAKWDGMLRAVGGCDVVHFDTQWTDLWCCQAGW